MKESYNIFDLVAKIDWEGGIQAVLEYGLREIDDYDVPETLKEAWAEMAEHFTEFEVLASIVSGMLHQAETTYDEEKIY